MISDRSYGKMCRRDKTVVGELKGEKDTVSEEVKTGK